jgi:hypothetical protein
VKHVDPNGSIRFLHIRQQVRPVCKTRNQFIVLGLVPSEIVKRVAVLSKAWIFHIPPNLVVERVTAHRKPPEVRICRLRNQSAVGTRPSSTSTPHCPACWARR